MQSLKIIKKKTKKKKRKELIFFLSSFVFLLITIDIVAVVTLGQAVGTKIVGISFSDEVVVVKTTDDMLAGVKVE